MGVTSSVADLNHLKAGFVRGAQVPPPQKCLQQREGERERQKEKKTHTQKTNKLTDTHTHTHTYTHTHTHSIVKILTFDKTANNASGSAVGLGGEREATANNKQAAGKAGLVRCARALV